MVDRLKNTEVNSRRIAAVENCFGSSGQPLQSHERVLIGEGVLMKMCRKKAKPRQFFIFNDLLVYGTILISKRRYSNQHVIPLEEVKVEDIPDEDDSKYGFLIKTRTKSFMVFAVSENEKEQWMQHICRCVQNLLKNGRQPAKDHAAVWVPDSEAEKCMCCLNTHFTVLNRRHHCRACGKVVCQRCSSKTFVLEGISKRPVRVCDICYNKLCHGMRTTPESPSSELPPIIDSSESDEEEIIVHSHEAPTFYGTSPPKRPERL